MSTARNEMVTALAGLTGLADFKIVGYSRKLTLERPTVMVRVDTVTPAGGNRDYAMSLIVAVPETDPTGPADDELDASLEDVLYVIDTSGDALGIRFNSATRATLDDAYPAYRVDVTVRRSKVSTP